jgi:hypothetical protein
LQAESCIITLQAMEIFASYMKTNFQQNDISWMLTGLRWRHATIKHVIYTDLQNILIRFGLGTNFQVKYFSFRLCVYVCAHARSTGL